MMLAMLVPLVWALAGLTIVVWLTRDRHWTSNSADPQLYDEYPVRHAA